MNRISRILYFIKNESEFRKLIMQMQINIFFILFVLSFDLISKKRGLFLFSTGLYVCSRNFFVYSNEIKEEIIIIRKYRVFFLVLKITIGIFSFGLSKYFFNPKCFKKQFIFYLISFLKSLFLDIFLFRKKKWLNNFSNEKFCFG